VDYRLKTVFRIISYLDLLLHSFVMKKIFIAVVLPCLLLLTQCRKEDVPAANPLNNRSVGASAKEFLSAASYQTLNIEIAYMPGYAPDATAIANLQGFLALLLNKPGGINITQRAIPASGKTAVTLGEIREIEKNTRTVFSTGSSLGVFIMYMDCDYSQANTLGIAHKNTSMAIFGKILKNNSGGVNQASLTKLETIILEHETGHLLGLTDLGSPMQVPHKDPASNHCSNSACLMYYATEINQMGGVLISGPVPPLDANCRNDLRANGGK
jgi:hypothetical protein